MTKCLYCGAETDWENLNLFCTEKCQIAYEKLAKYGINIEDNEYDGY